MKILYLILVILFLVLLAFYIFTSLRLSFLSRKKEKIIRDHMDNKDIDVVDAYKRAVRVTMKEIFLGLDNGKDSKK